MKSIISRASLAIVLSTILLFGACHKEKVVSTPPPPPPPAAPTATLAVNPQTIEKGQSATLVWETTNADTLSIEANGSAVEALGEVKPNGSRQVSPTESMTYTLSAKGPGGKETATARITVTVPPPPPEAKGPSEDELFSRNMRDVFFDFDQWQIREDQRSVVQTDAAFLRQHPNVNFTVEGHCDERGSVEYNLALGAKRATTVMEALASEGVGSGNMRTMSYGKEKPACTEHDESCWRENRRGHMNHDR